jgi:hypothetical protein
MDQATLVVPDIGAANEAIAALKAANLQRIVAFFAVFPEYGDRRLVISSPSLDQTRPLRAQDRVAEILAGRFVYSLPIIMVLPEKNPIVRAVRAFNSKVKVAPGGIIHLGSRVFGDRYVDDLQIVQV